MRVLELVVYALAVVFALSWMWGIRTNVHRGVGITWPTATIVTFWVVALVVVPLASLSAFHLLWIFPACLALGPLSLALRILWLPARVLVFFCTIGLDNREVAMNSARVKKFHELVAGGVEPEIAKGRVLEEYPLGRA